MPILNQPRRVTMTDRETIRAWVAGATDAEPGMAAKLAGSLSATIDRLRKERDALVSERDALTADRDSWRAQAERLLTHDS